MRIDTDSRLNQVAQEFLHVKAEEMKEPKPIDESKEQKPYQKLSDKEKRAKAWLEKWKKEQGLS